MHAASFDRHVKILGSGRYLAKRRIEAEELDRIMGVPIGSVFNATGAQTRYWIEQETATDMAAFAATAALDKAQMRAADLDAIISTNGVNQQPIPTGACLLSEKLGLQNTRIPCFDVNASCMSFYQGLDIASHLLASSTYKSILVCSSDVTSTGINFKDIKSAPLFSDAAGAVVVAKDPTRQSGIYLSHHETYSRGAHHSEIRGGGNHMPAMQYSDATHADFVYSLNGPAMGKIVFEEIEGFLERGFAQRQLDLATVIKDIAAVIPHQVSPPFIRLLKKKLKVPESKAVDLTSTHGNMLAASVPFGLDYAIAQGKINRGDSLLIFGGGSGISLGMMYLKY